MSVDMNSVGIFRMERPKKRLQKPNWKQARASRPKVIKATIKTHSVEEFIRHAVPSFKKP